MKSITLVIIVALLTVSANVSWASDESLSFINVENKGTVASENFAGTDNVEASVDENVSLDKVSGLQLKTDGELDEYIDRYLAKSSTRDKRRFKRQWLSRAKSNELQAAAHRQELEEKGSAKWELSEGTKDYLHRSGQQVLYGNYTEECTALGTAGEVALGLSGLDAPADIRDLSHDIRNPEMSWSWAAKTAVDGASLLPVVGALKHAGKVKKLAIKALKNGDKACKITKHVAKNGDTIAEAAQALVKKTRRTVIGFSESAVESTLSKLSRVDHGSRHLFEHGVFQGVSHASKKGRNAFRKAAKSIMMNPIATFDHVLTRGKQAVKGFYGKVNGKDVVIFFAKEKRGKIAVGDLVTAVTPSPRQIANWGLKS